MLNAAWGLIAAGQLADGTSAFSNTALYTAILGVFISTAGYYNVLKPLNMTSNAGGTLAKVGVK